MTRAERVEQVNALKREGLNGLQIAERLGISKTFVYELLADPEGVSTRERKLKAGGVCIDCGAPTAYKTGGPAKRCKACQVTFEHESRHWTREAIIEWIRAYVAREGKVPPSSLLSRYRRRGSDAPYVDAVTEAFGPKCWRQAVLDAGFRPYRDISIAFPGPLGPDHPTVQEMLRLRAEGWSITEIAHHQGVTPSAIWQRLARHGKVAA